VVETTTHKDKGNAEGQFKARRPTGRRASRYETEGEINGKAPD
jgi:hypothetical protein